MYSEVRKRELQDHELNTDVSCRLDDPCRHAQHRIQEDFSRPVNPTPHPITPSPIRDRPWTRYTVAIITTVIIIL